MTREAAIHSSDCTGRTVCLPQAPVPCSSAAGWRRHAHGSLAWAGCDGQEHAGSAQTGERTAPQPSGSADLARARRREARGSPALQSRIITVVDIGGTWTRLGQLAPPSEARFPTRRSTPATAEELVGTIREWARNHSTHHIAIACPGLVTPDGVVRLSFLQVLDGLPLGALTSEATGLPTTVMNDADAQALGASEPGERLAYFALGTRVGGAVAENKRILQRPSRYIGEFGHLSCGYKGSVPCECGADDCLDLAVAGFRLEERHGTNWWKDPTSRAAILSAVSPYLARAIRSIHVTVSPDRVVLAGPLAAHSQLSTDLAALMDPWVWTIGRLDLLPDIWPIAAEGLRRAVDDPSTYRTE